MRRLQTPLDRETIESLHAGEQVLLSGIVYTARDAAHQRMLHCLAQGEQLPIDLDGQVIFYAGPTPTPPGKVIGSIGPTTSTRMDSATPALLQLGLAATIGKGQRSDEVKQAMLGRAVYFIAPGGAAAQMAQCVVSCQEIAWLDLGTESIKKLMLKDLPLIVAIDSKGQDAFQLGQRAYLQSLQGRHLT